MTGIPYTWEEGIVILASVLSLLILVIAISVKKKIGIGKDFAISLAMGGIQLFLIAIFLTFLFTYDRWYLLIWILLGTMVIVGGYTSAKRAPDMPQAFRISTLGILSGSLLVLCVLAVSQAMPLQPQFIIPFAGMSFGNCMALCSLTLERLIREVQVNKPVIETALSLGANSQQAVENYSSLSIRASLIPTIDRLKTLGIIFIPGAMSGLIIAGTDPLVAAEYQIIVFLMIVGGGVITSLITAHLARKQVFTDAEQVSDWID